MTINAATVAADIASVQERIAALGSLDAHTPIDETEWIDLLCAARKSQRLTQRDVADRMGTTQSAVSSIEKGTVTPRIRTLARYAAAVGYQMDLTFRRLDDPTGAIGASA